MMPHTVPNSPMNGVMLAVVARNGTRSSSLLSSTARRTEQRPVDRVEALERWTRRGGGLACRHRPFSCAQLGVQLGIAGLEDPDQRAGRQRRTDSLHFGELRALAEDAEEGRGLLLGAAERPDFVEDDRPGNGAENQQDEQDDLADDASRLRPAGRCRCCGRFRRSQPAPRLAQPAQAQRKAIAIRPPTKQSLTSICVTTHR